jgi:amidase
VPVSDADLTSFGAVELSELIHAERVSCREVMTAFLDRIDHRNGELNAIVSRRDRDALVEEARQCDDELAAGFSRGWMHGLPQAIKDLAETQGLRTTMGSPLFRDYVPEHDALMVARMRRSGCLIVGKTNVPEFGKGSHTFNEVFGATRNAYDQSRSAGGSSGGAAVALATRMLPVADGSDYMGSLRNPAAWNNVFGFRPSQGRVPAHPARDQYLSQLGTEGPMGRSVIDLAMLLGTQAGYDARVPLSLDGSLTEFTDIATARTTLALFDPRPIRVGWLADLDGHLAMEPGILDVCVAGLKRLAELGCTVDSAVLHFPPEELWDAWLTWRHISVAGGIGAQVDDEFRQLVKPEVLWEIDRAGALTIEDVDRAVAVRTRYYLAVESLFHHFDVLVLPSAQVWPFPVEQRWPDHIADRAMDTYHRWMEVALYATFAGLPAISVPVGFDERGLPMGMQLIGAPRADVEVLCVAHAYEATIGHLDIGRA